MSMMQAVKSVFSKYATFEGRARRSEFWLFFLFNSLVGLAVIILSYVIGISAVRNAYSFSLGSLGGNMIVRGLYGIYSLACILPGVAVSCRRLHDIGRSGAYLLFVLIPIVGCIFLLIWLIQDGTPGVNIYGADPKGRGGQYGYAQPEPIPQQYTPPQYTQPKNSAQEVRGAADVGATVGQAAVRESVRVPVLVAESGVFQGSRFSVQGTLRMGRTAENNLVFPQDLLEISRKHCEFTARDGRLFVQDLGSTNGTFINRGYRLIPGQPVELNPGDCVTLGTLNDTFRVE
ncbi:MAG: DUF805 domain-containing protein [Oscillospiraceae bacterium]|nr:DUF805 domain-containing protein [Oscillospiraceae bacterium]